jgi:hypothetical protein
VREISLWTCGWLVSESVWLWLWWAVGYQAHPQPLASVANLPVPCFLPSRVYDTQGTAISRTNCRRMHELVKCSRHGHGTDSCF